MKPYSHKCFVAFKAAEALDVDKLTAALSSGTESGPCNVVVTLHRDKDGKEDGYTLSGTAVQADPEDFEDTSEIDARLARDLGEVGRGDEDLGIKAGEPYSLLYVVNHDGLPLAYNRAFRNEFAKRSGRVNQAEVGQALAWAAGRAEMKPVLEKGDIASLVAAYRGRDAK